MQGCGLGKKQIGSVKGKIAVNFIGGYLMITFNAELPARVHKRSSAHYVGL